MSLGGKLPSDPILVDAIHAAAAQASCSSRPPETTAPRLLAGSGPPARRAAGAATASRSARPTSTAAARASRTGARTSRSWRPATYSGTYAGVRRGASACEPARGRRFPTWDGDGTPTTAYLAGHVVRVARGRRCRGADLGGEPGADELPGRRHPQAVRLPDACSTGRRDGLRHPRRRRRARAGDEPARVRVGRDAATPSGAVCTAFGNAPATWPTEKSQTIAVRDDRGTSTWATATSR